MARSRRKPPTVASGVYRRIGPEPDNPRAAAPATVLDLQNWYDAVVA